MILKLPLGLDTVDLAKIEAEYSARFVCELPLKQTHGWRDAPSLIFYTETPHPQGSNYFAISYQEESGYVISNALSSVQDEIVGVRAANGDVIYSHWRHDWRTSPDDSVWVDGGRDYVRHSGGEIVSLRIVEGELVEVKDDPTTQPG